MAKLWVTLLETIRKQSYIKHLINANCVICQQCVIILCGRGFCAALAQLCVAQCGASDQTDGAGIRLGPDSMTERTQTRFFTVLHLGLNANIEADLRKCRFLRYIQLVFFSNIMIKITAGVLHEGYLSCQNWATWQKYLYFCCWLWINRIIC